MHGSLIYDYTQEIDVHSMLFIWAPHFLNKYMKLLKVVTLEL